MKERNIFQSVNERDIDLLVLEELNVSDSFAQWFVCRVREELIPVKTLSAWHSVIDTNLGESDLVYIYQSDDLSAQALLIENKIDASAQLQQGDRYRLRGKKGIEDSIWQDFRTCIIAPKAYIDRNTEPYDAAISYEEIMVFLVAQGDKRGLYRAQTLKDAIEKNRRGYVATVCPKTTEFAQEYLAYVSKHFPQLNPEKSKPRANGHDWIHFYPNPLNRKIRIIHQIYGKVIKLQFLGQAENFDDIKNHFESLEPSGYRIIKSGKSVNIETPLPEISITDQSFDSVLEEIDIAINKAQQLHSLMKNYHCA
ncbi:PD-(D/E)XK nuclease superfamily protein [Vibrio sp. 10N.286.49.E11]|uniref:PD-(D/E)XK nuclease superfamily protein n=1 Tax=unclassified Vibrio TaxID=2614977 RepID=UPI00354FA6D6